MIKAVIFDCFGVLTSDGWFAFVAEHFKEGSDLFHRAHDLNKQSNAGLITYGEFTQQLAELAHVSNEVVTNALGNNVPNAALFSYIKSLKQSYLLGILSNASDNWLQELFSSEQLGLFDATVLSYEVGHIKPHPSVYHAICNKLGVEPAEAVFIDDIERYVTGAKDIGMHGIWFKNNQQLQQELDQLLADSNS